MSNLEKLFCKRRALGLTDEDELFECLSAEAPEGKEGGGSDTDGHARVGEHSGQRLRHDEKRQSAAEIRHMEDE